ncbi:MAG: hypothetical protein LUG98_13555 [Tannerellaceae bacterium]|nr:hypothetical protein [Tannerellaceae bacterium]
MKKLNTLLLSIWGSVFLYILIFINSNLYSWWWVIGLFILFFGMVIVCIASGSLGYSKYGNPWIPALINGLSAILAVIMLGGTRGDPGTAITLVGPGAFFITLISAGVTFVFIGKPTPLRQEPASPTELVQVKPPHPLPPVIRYPMMGGILIGLYLLVAYFSQFELFPVEQETYWKEITPNPDPGIFQFERVPDEIRDGHQNEYYILDPYGNPFTGIIHRYEPHLRVNPFPPKPKGVDYYINGQKWGESVASYKVTPPFEINTHTRIHKISFEDSYPPYFIHTWYADNVTRLLKKYAPVYVIHSAGNPLVHYLLSYNEIENKIIRTTIVYHKNKIIKSITYEEELRLNDELGWSSGYTIEIDALGFIKEPVPMNPKWRGSKWKREDFVYTEHLPDLIQEREATGIKKEKLREKLLAIRHTHLPDHSYVWDEQKTWIENLSGLHGIGDITGENLIWK